MKLKAVQIIHGWRESELTITTAEKGELQRIYDEIGEIDPETEYDVTIKKRKKKRSQDANGYMWALLGELAVKVRNSSIELYKHFIRNYGQYYPIPVREDAIDSFSEVWSSNGIAWFTEDIGKCKTLDGYHTLLAYYGSSQYDSKQMARLIEEVVDECKAQGIETMTPAELQAMIQKEEEYEQRNSNRETN